DTHPVIPNPNLDLATTHTNEFHVQVSIRRRASLQRVYRVGEQVHYHLLNLGPDSHRVAASFELGFQTHILRLELALEQREHFSDGISDVHAFARGLLAAEQQAKIADD